MEFTMVNGDIYLIVKEGLTRELHLVPKQFTDSKKTEVVTVPKFAPVIPIYTRVTPVQPVKSNLRMRLDAQNIKSDIRNRFLAVSLFAVSFVTGLFSAI